MHAERERESAAERHDLTTALNPSVEGGDRDLTFHLWHNHLARCCRASARDGLRAASKTRAWRCVQSYGDGGLAVRVRGPRPQFVHGGSTWPSPSVQRRSWGFARHPLRQAISVYESAFQPHLRLGLFARKRALLILSKFRSPTKTFVRSVRCRRTNKLNIILRLTKSPTINTLNLMERGSQLCVAEERAAGPNPRSEAVGSRSNSIWLGPGPAQMRSTK